MERQRKNVRCGPTSVSSTKGFYDSGAFALSDYDNGLNITEFQENLDVIIQTVSERELVFDLVGVDAPVANALRRILIGELPTMAIEYVYIHNNSSVIQDEVLAHRMGLLPVQADPRLFEFAPKPEVDPSDDELKHKPEANNTLEFRLKVKCTRQGNTVVNSHVTSSMLEWVPLEGQEHLAGPNQPGIVDDDIVIARLGPGQEIDLTCHCIKGIGREHAKWSPVCTASYRLLPVIKVDESFPAAHAEDLVRKCPMGVFEIEELASKVVASKPRNCTTCRECIRENGWDKLIQLDKRRDHFIFSIESTGALSPAELFEQSIDILMEKSSSLRKELAVGHDDPMDEGNNIA